MVQIQASVTQIAIAQSPAILSQRPVSGWENWKEITPAPAPSPVIRTGTSIYTFTATEIQKLRDKGLITDETHLYFRMRVENSPQMRIRTINSDAIGIPNSRCFSGLSRLQADRMISQFVLDTPITLTWLKTVAAMTETEIRSQYQHGVLDELSYTFQVLNYLRGAATTQTLDLNQLLTNWAINSRMLGNSLVSLEAKEKGYITGNTGTLSAKFFEPLLTGAISREELLEMRSLNLIGNSFYCYAICRSQFGSNPQVIEPETIKRLWGVTHSDLFRALWRFKRRGFLSAVNLNQLVLNWIYEPPRYNREQVENLKKAFLRPTGFFMWAIASEISPGFGSSTQLIDIANFTARWDITKEPVDNPHELALNFLSRMVEEGIITLDLPSFAVSWV